MSSWQTQAEPLPLLDHVCVCVCVCVYQCQLVTIKYIVHVHVHSHYMSIHTHVLNIVQIYVHENWQNWNGSWWIGLKLVPFLSTCFQIVTCTCTCALYHVAICLHVHLYTFQWIHTNLATPTTPNTTPNATPTYHVHQFWWIVHGQHCCCNI